MTFQENRLMSNGSREQSERRGWELVPPNISIILFRWWGPIRRGFAITFLDLSHLLKTSWKNSGPERLTARNINVVTNDLCALCLPDSHLPIQSFALVVSRLWFLQSVLLSIVVRDHRLSRRQEICPKRRSLPVGQWNLSVNIEYVGAPTHSPIG